MIQNIFQKMIYPLEGAEQAREAIAKQSARPPLVNVGSFTKRSEVKRRATLTNKYPN